MTNCPDDNVVRRHLEICFALRNDGNVIERSIQIRRRGEFETYWGDPSVVNPPLLPEHITTKLRLH